MSEQFVCLTKDLPKSIIRALESVSYNRKDIHVRIRDEESLGCGGGNGYRAFAIVVNLSDGQYETLWGSWGGANIFNPTNRVDMDAQSRKLGENVAVIKGHIGGDKPTYATVTIGNKNIVPCLPAAPELSLRDKQILYCFCYLKSGPYRKSELASIRANEGEIDSLVSRGFLKKDGRGIQSTVSGKNAMVNIFSMPRE